MRISKGQTSTWKTKVATHPPKPAAKLADIANISNVCPTVEPGGIVIQCDVEPTVEEMLAAFDPKKHGGEAMADRPVGDEVGAR